MLHPQQCPAQTSKNAHAELRGVLSEMQFLIVDDMQTMRKMIRSMLTSLGVTRWIAEASDGLEAWEKLSTIKYDFIICDINMPRMDGLEFLKRVRESRDYRDIPVLMITGEVTEEIVASAAESEVDHYLLKPFQLGALEERIREVIHKKKNPSPGELLFRQALDHCQAREYNQALERGLTLCQPPYVRQAKVLNLVGECYLELGDLDKANQFVSAALELNPRYIKAYKNFARIKERGGKLDEAIKILQVANQINPRNGDRLLHLGRLLLQTEESTAARECFDRALKYNPNDSPQLQREVAEILLQTGHAAEAEAMFIKSINQDPDNIHLYNRLGVALRQQKKHQDAMKWYQKALKIDPHHETTHYNLGILFLDLGQKDQARNSLQTALRLRPDFPEAQQLYNHFFGVPAA